MATVYRNGHSHAYKSIRRGGKVTSEYRGAGVLAELRAEVDAAERARREASRDADRAWRGALEAAEQEVVAMFEQVESVTAEAVAAAGYYRHHRGEWRRAGRG